MRRVVPIAMVLAATVALLFVPGTGHADAYTYCSGNARFIQTQTPTPADPLSPIRKDCVSGTGGQPPNFTPTADTPVTMTIEGTSFTGTLTARIVPVSGSLVGGGGTASGIFVNGQLVAPVPGQPNTPDAVLLPGTSYKVVATAHGLGVFIASISPRATEPLPTSN